MRVADFFCGGGGFSEGFRQAGFEIVFAVDKWAPAVNTYKGNKPGANVIQDDVIRISNLPDDEFEALVPDSEVIIGSPPCQSFSHGRKNIKIRFCFISVRILCIVLRERGFSLVFGKYLFWSEI